MICRLCGQAIVDDDGVEVDGEVVAHELCIIRALLISTPVKQVTLAQWLRAVRHD